MNRTLAISTFAVLVLTSCGERSSSGTSTDASPTIDSEVVHVDGGQAGVDGETLSDNPIVDPNDPRAFLFTPGMRRLGNDGRVRVAVLSADPPPNVKGDSRWLLSVTNVAGEPISGAKLVIESTMPDHRHGTTAPTVTELSSGTYEAAHMNLYMLGFWFVSIDVMVGDTRFDTVTLGFLTSQ